MASILRPSSPAREILRTSINRATTAKSYLQQVGSNNGVTAIGVTNLPGLFNNIFQDASANGSTVVLNQNGANNSFDIGQGGSNNSSTVNQSGDTENYVWIRQTPQDATFTNTGVFTPTGGSNSTIGITQISLGGPTYAVAAQGRGSNKNISRRTGAESSA